LSSGSGKSERTSYAFALPVNRALIASGKIAQHRNAICRRTLGVRLADVCSFNP
jgi:hypothetical protein